MMHNEQCLDYLWRICLVVQEHHSEDGDQPERLDPGQARHQRTRRLLLHRVHLQRLVHNRDHCQVNYS